MDGAITVYHGTKKTVEEEVIQGGVVARSPVQNLAGAGFRIMPEPGVAAWRGEILLVP